MPKEITISKVLEETRKLKFNVDSKSDNYWNGKDNKRAHARVFDQETMLHIYNNAIDDMEEIIRQSLTALIDSAPSEEVPDGLEFSDNFIRGINAHCAGINKWKEKVKK